MLPFDLLRLHTKKSQFTCVGDVCFSTSEYGREGEKESERENRQTDRQTDR